MPDAIPTVEYGGLPPGARLDRYLIKRLIASGGFGITYEVEHTTLGGRFAMKEHFPRQFAFRSGTSVQPNASEASTFSWSLDRFIDEGKKLTQFNNPAIVTVSDIFRANGTAYLVMDYIDGISLSAWLEKLRRPPSEAELDKLLMPLLDALEHVHAAEFLHRDIAPDNILVKADGTPCLIDFGAARQAMGQYSKTLTAIVKAGYSPIEQYDTEGHEGQGAWSDIYALGATLYRAVTGTRPPEAPGRLIKDKLVPAATAAEGRYSFQLLRMIDLSLKVLPHERPQSIKHLRGELRLLLAEPPAPGVGREPPPIPASKPKLPPVPSPKPSSKPDLAGGGEKDTAASAGHAAVTTPPPTRQSGPVLAISLLAAIVGPLVGAAWWFTKNPIYLGDATTTPAVALPLDRTLTVLEESALKPKSEFQECAGCPRMVVVPSGRFLMGSPPDEKDRYSDEGPVHEVVIARPFAVGKFEVTFEEWEACVTDGGCQSNRSPPDQEWGRFLLPVINVTWSDAKEYVAWLSRKTGKGYRLLTEAEWEYAARAGTTTPFHFGDSDNSLREHGWFVRNSNSRTHPVGRKLANPFGLRDMHGNVWEWVEDCYANTYTSAPSDGSAWTTADCNERVVRGGSWGDHLRRLRSASRDKTLAFNRYKSIGFRVARTLAP